MYGKNMEYRGPTTLAKVTHSLKPFLTSQLDILSPSPKFFSSYLF